MYLFFRRIFEVLASLILIILLSPLFIISAFLIKITSRGPVIFKQKRVGQNEKNFIMYKFRTMKISTEGTNKDRTTFIGRILRTTSIDELPQLFNVFVGTMSFIGPRPSILEETEWIRLRQEGNVYAVKPGLTGWAQVNGRNTLTCEEKAKFDTYYVENVNLFLDIRILFRTFFYLITFKDINKR